MKEETDEIARERKILESLPPHPHIVRLFDVFWEELGAKGNRLYFAMEYMELGTIVSVLEKVRGVEEGSTSSGKEIPEVLLKYATLQILEGLTHLHSIFFCFLLVLSPFIYFTHLYFFSLSFFYSPSLLFLPSRPPHHPS